MAEKFGDMSAEELGKLALSKGIQCDPLADSRRAIIAKLKAAGEKKPKD